jgi:hypothetical protein
MNRRVRQAYKQESGFSTNTKAKTKQFDREQLLIFN